MSDFDWRYHHLQQVEQSETDSPLGGWQLLTKMHRARSKGDGVTEWAADDLRVFRLAQTSDIDGGLIAAVRFDLPLEVAIRRLDTYLGYVELDEAIPLRLYTQMDRRELTTEREQLAEELLGENPPEDPAEREALYKQRHAYSNTLTARKLRAVENALGKRFP